MARKKGSKNRPKSEEKITPEIVDVVEEVVIVDLDNQPVVEEQPVSLENDQESLPYTIQAVNRRLGYRSWYRVCQGNSIISVEYSRTAARKKALDFNRTLGLDSVSEIM